MTLNPQAKYLKDYQTPDFFIPETELTIELHDNQTSVMSCLQLVKNGTHSRHLKLDSQVKEVSKVSIDGVPINNWTLEQDCLEIPVDLERFTLEIEAIVDPENNKALEGLYKSAGVFCTQCEAEGFRKITPFLDRPDVLSKYKVNVLAEKSIYPHILANGNLVDSYDKDINGVTFRCNTWVDPHPKPSYLFALVAGDFDLLTDSFTTASGRKIALELYVDKGNLSLGHHAMASLVKSMEWDEQTYGLEYDLDTYMVVAVDFFNMGAMENKGLNIFNSKYVLADEKTATDADYHGIESVIAHEYFHNWTGNRITCRDWFQLSLKEGLTVFRDQQFSADMGTEVIERISHASVMRTHQFDEDAGPMAHPIRPEKVIEMNNFYTVTVYDKGAEVIRMMQSILSQSGFRKGMDLYFERHDGQAVTCDDFVNAMADANNTDLSQFKNWYSQAGTPVVHVDESQNENSLTLTLSQSIPSREDKEQVKTLVIPVAYELLSKTTGQSLKRGTLLLTEPQQLFKLDVNEEATLVLFENFSAPVKVERTQSVSDLVHIIKYASDAFSRWDSMQTLWQMQIASDKTLLDFAELFKSIVESEHLTNDIKAELLSIPSFSEVAQSFDIVDVDKILTAIENIVIEIAKISEPLIKTQLKQFANIENGYAIDKVANRRLKAVLLQYLAAVKSTENSKIIADVFNNATNMTEKVAALNAAREADIELLDTLLTNMDSEHPDSVLVLDKMLSQVARVDSVEVYQKMEQWAQHRNFSMDNPNRVRSLYAVFAAGNPKIFHHQSGKGYEFLADLLLKLDQFNPQLAARMVVPLMAFNRYDTERKDKMKQALTRMSQAKLSKDMFEKVSAALNG